MNPFFWNKSLRIGPERTEQTRRALPEESAVAITVNGSSQAVMMTTPADLEDFAVGFAFSEGFAPPDQIESLEIIEFDTGIEARIWVADEIAEQLGERRRAMLGPVGCGLCGVDTLEQALRQVPCLDAGGQLSRARALSATEALRDEQPLHDLTHAVHAAGFVTEDQGLVAVREDVGRHNALDKLIGACLRDGVEMSKGAIVMTSRISVELVQKAALAGCPILIAVSAPTAHAVRLAEEAGLTIAGIARSGSLDLFTHPERIT